MKKVILSLYLIILILIFSFVRHPLLKSVGVTRAVPETSPVISLDIWQDSWYIYMGINTEREAAGLPDLTLDSTLTIIAFMRSQDMVDQGYFAHISPDGRTYKDYLYMAQFPWNTSGENLARIMNGDPVDLSINGFMSSDEHRANILNPDYNLIGVGVVQSGGTFLVTVVFVGN